MQKKEDLSLAYLNPMVFKQAIDYAFTEYKKSH